MSGTSTQLVVKLPDEREIKIGVTGGTSAVEVREAICEAVGLKNAKAFSLWLETKLGTTDFDYPLPLQTPVLSSMKDVAKECGLTGPAILRFRSIPVLPLEEELQVTDPVALQLLASIAMQHVTRGLYAVEFEDCPAYAALHLANISLVQLVKELFNRLRQKLPSDVLEQAAAALSAHTSETKQEEEDSSKPDLSSVLPQLASSCIKIIKEQSGTLPSLPLKEVEKEIKRRPGVYFSQDALNIMEREGSWTKVIEEVKTCFDRYTRTCVCEALAVLGGLEQGEQESEDKTQPSDDKPKEDDPEKAPETLPSWPALETAWASFASSVGQDFVRALVEKGDGSNEKSIAKLATIKISSTLLTRARKFHSYGSVFIKAKTKIGETVMDILMGIHYTGLHVLDSEGEELFLHAYDKVTIATATATHPMGEILVMKIRDKDEREAEYVYNIGKAQGSLTKRLISQNMSYAQLLARKKEQEELLGTKLTLENRVDTLTAEVTQLNSEVENLQSEVEELRSLSTEQEEEIKAYKKKEEEWESKEKALHDKEDSVEDDKSVDGHKKVSRDFVDYSSTRAGKASGRVAVSGPGSAKDVERLRSQVVTQAKQLDALHARLEKQQKEHTSLKLKCAAQAKELETAKSRTTQQVQKLETKLVRDSALTEKQKDATEQELKITKQKLKESEAKLAQLESRRVVVEEVAAAGVDEEVYRELEKKLTRANERCSTLEGENVALRKRLSDMQAQVVSAKKNDEGNAQSVADVERQLASASSAHAAELERIEKTREKEAKEYKERLDKASKDHERQLAKVKGETEALQKDLDLLRQDMTDKSRTTAKKQTEQEQEVKEMRQRIKLLTTAEAEHAETIDKLNTSLAEKEKALSVANERISALSAENSKLSARLRELESVAATVDSYKTKNKELTEAAAHAEQEMSTALKLYKDESVLRKKYYNVIEDMKGKIRVYVRCRPFSGKELAQNYGTAVTIPDNYTITVLDSRTSKPKSFEFDGAFRETCTQEQVFSDTNHLIQCAIDGFNVCIFAFGQTGAGKTHSMTGGEGELRGITPRAFDLVFDTIRSDTTHTYTVSLYMVELYNETLADLLTDNSDGTKLDIVRDKETDLITVTNVTIRQATSAAEILKIYDEGVGRRVTASTLMNERSSRSHQICSVLVRAVNNATGAVTTGKLSLIDLAGSERLSKSGSTEDRAKEATSINKSLSALNDVIVACSNGEKHIPYRNHKLTMLMSDSIGGNSKTLMLACVSPADYNADETMLTLAYASRVKTITNESSRNLETKEIARLKKQVAQLQLKLDDMSRFDEIRTALTGPSSSLVSPTSPSSGEVSLGSPRPTTKKSGASGAAKTKK